MAVGIGGENGRDPGRGKVSIEELTGFTPEKAEQFGDLLSLAGIATRPRLTRGGQAPECYR